MVKSSEKNLSMKSEKFNIYKSIRKHAALALTALLSAVSLISCSHADEPEGGEDTDVQVVFKISPIAAATQPGTGPVEKVNALRVIMISSEGRLAVNEKIQLPQSEYNASQFVYTLRKTIPSGKWKVFLIGNEGSVGSVLLKDPSLAPKGMPTTSLSAMLDFFKTEEEEEMKEEFTGVAMEKVLNSVYFKNDNVGTAKGSAVYLPYSSYYDLDVKYHSKVNATMYLVPAAAKIDFIFSNYRKQDIKIEDIEILGFNTHNYLNAQLDPSEKTRKLNGVDTWWVDWLQACASASQDTNDDATFNSGWGWIEKYSLPVLGEKTWVKQLNPKKENWIITRLRDAYNPPKLYIGPYYVPESINLTRPELTEEEEAQFKEGQQSYWVTFYIHEKDEPEIKKLANYHIDTVNALFRATHVEVYVELYDSRVEIYAELHDWSESHFVGYVQQEDDE